MITSTAHMYGKNNKIFFYYSDSRLRDSDTRQHENHMTVYVKSKEITNLTQNIINKQQVITTKITC